MQIKMFPRTFSLIIQNCVIFAAIFVQQVQLDNSVANTLCSMKTNELIEFYGYEAETHHVVTEDGYNLTMFRCNSKTNSTTQKKPPVILQHGLLISSDDFCINPPHQALAYILADNGYDVWLPNSRGNVYSRKHVSKDADNILSDFWNFTWYEMGIYDQPAVIDYILEKTMNPKLFYIGYSQGTTSLMILLSEKPEYNEKIHVASLLAPVGYMNHDDVLYQILSRVAPLFDSFDETEVFPRSPFLGKLIHTVCARDLKFCNTIVDLICGESENQRNDSMLIAFVCHVPSGASIKQLFHYAQLIKSGFFGKYRKNLKIPPDFLLSRITAPITLHYSTADKLANAIDALRLISKLKNSVVYVQPIDKPRFNHIDFLWGINAASLIYSKILKLFKKYQ